MDGTMMRKTCIGLLGCLCALWAFGCCKVNKVPVGEEMVLPSTTFSFDKEDYPGPEYLFPLYTIQPGDIMDVLFQVRSWEQEKTFTVGVGDSISIKFVHAPELNEEQIIQPDGKISLPYLGRIQVSGKTTDEISSELVERYSHYLNNPDLWITVPEYRAHIQELKKDLHTASRGLSRLVTVRPDGFCTFPLIGDQHIAGKSVPEVNDQMNILYDRYLPGLHVDLFLHETAGTVVYVLGWVNEPGSYQISKPISIPQALSLAKGQNDESDLSNVVVFRRHKDQLHGTRVDVDSMLNLHRGGKFFWLKGDDIIYVPRRGLSEWAQVMREVADVVFFRGWHLSGTLFRGSLVDWEATGDSR